MLCEYSLYSPRPSFLGISWAATLGYKLLEYHYEVNSRIHKHDCDSAFFYHSFRWHVGRRDHTQLSFESSVTSSGLIQEPRLCSFSPVRCSKAATHAVSMQVRT